MHTEAIIYATPMNYETPIEGSRLPFFYLHSIAEKINGYDCCNGNIEAFNYALSAGAFLADLIFVDGRKERCIVTSNLSNGRMHGLIAMLSDIEGVKEIFYDFTDFPCMYDHFKGELKEKYPNVLAAIKETCK